MNKKIVILFISLIFYQILNAQKFDQEIYSHLLNSDTTEFVKYSSKLGFETDFSFNANRYYAQTKRLSISKIISGNGFPNDGSVMVVCSLDKKDIELILENAKQVVKRQDTLIDKKYIYIRSEHINDKNEITYRVDVFRLKQWKSFYKMKL